MRQCTRCEGAGKVESLVDKGQFRKCYACDGRGEFPLLDVPGILSIIVSSRGKSKGKLLSSRPDYKKGGRAYYVWRLARFHGGADLCMPVMADVDVSGDPYREELDKLAEAVAQRAFGSNMTAAYRWGHALGYVQSVPDGLPASAYPGGPVGTDIGSLADSPEFHADRYDHAREAEDTDTEAEYEDLPLFAGR